LLVIVALIYVGWCAFLYFMQDRMMFPRGMAAAATPEEIIPPTITRLWVATKDGTKTEGWLLPFKTSNGERAPAVILTHGNAELIDDCLGDAARWNARGFHVLLCEYRGYGRSGGSPGQKGISADVAAFYDLLAAREDVAPARIYAHGRSLGAAVAVQLAAARPIAGLILESPFKSAASFAVRFGAPPFLVKSPFRTDRVLPTLRTPVLMLHSTEDDIIPVAHSRALKAVRPDATLVEMTGGHNSGLSNRREYWAAIDDWMRAR
jgi:fermentation-respiration switch protein FrsA (DUF1100 family)